MRANGEPEEKQGARSRRHPLSRAFLYLVLLVGAGIGASLVAALFTSGLGWMLQSRDGGHPPGGWELAILYAALAAAVLLATWGMTTGVEGRPFRTVGFSWDRRAAGEIGFGLALGVGLQTAIVAAWALFGAAAFEAVRWDDLPPFPRWLPATAGWAASALTWGLLLFVPAALCEELAVRGYLLPTLAEAWGDRAALGVTSLLFGALHLMNPGASPFAFAGTAAAGVMLGLAYLRSGRLWLPWALHVGWNWAQGSLWGLPVSGTDVPSVFQARLEAPWLWTGGPFGPEASVSGLLAVAFGIALLACWRSREERNGTTS